MIGVRLNWKSIVVGSMKGPVTWLPVLSVHNNTGTNLMMYDMCEVSYGIVSQVLILVSQFDVNALKSL